MVTEIPSPPRMLKGKSPRKAMSDFWWATTIPDGLYSFCTQLLLLSPLSPPPLLFFGS